MPAGYDPCPAVFVDIYDAYLLATGEIAQNSVLGGGSKPYVKGGGGVHCKGLKLAYIKVFLSLVVNRSQGDGAGVLRSLALGRLGDRRSLRLCGGLRLCGRVGLSGSLGSLGSL